MAGTTAATSGNLTIMFGSPSDLASGHAVPLLQRMAREGGVIPCGRNGTGVGVKVCNKYITLQHPELRADLQLDPCGKPNCTGRGSSIRQITRYRSCPTPQRRQFLIRSVFLRQLSGTNKRSIMVIKSELPLTRSPK
jgi:hypothetical protein